MSDPTKSQTTVIKPPPFKVSPLHSSRKYIKELIYGPFGCGKTSLAGSAVDVPQMRDVIMINAESGTLSIEDADHIEHSRLIDQIPATNFTSVASVQEFLKAHCIHRDANDIQRLRNLQARVFGIDPEIIDVESKTDEFDDEGNLLKARLRKYHTVIVDSLTEIDTYSMYQLLGIKTDMKLDEDMDVAQFAEFRKNNQLMQLLVRAYRDLPMNVILVCSTQYNQDELKQMHWAPSLTGKLASQVQGFVDIVGYMQVGKPKEGEKTIPRRLWIQPVGRFDAKNRIASFKESFIDNPTQSKLIAAFRGSKAAK